MKDNKKNKESKNTKSQYRLKGYEIPERRTYIGDRDTNENNPYKNDAYLRFQQKVDEVQKNAEKKKQYDDYEKYKSETNQYLNDSQWVPTPNRKLYSIIWGIIFLLAGAFLDVNGWHVTAWIFFALTGMSVLTFFNSPK